MFVAAATLASCLQAAVGGGDNRDDSHGQPDPQVGGEPVVVAAVGHMSARGHAVREQHRRTERRLPAGQHRHGSRRAGQHARTWPQARV